jgi:hypothetical protein
VSEALIFSFITVNSISDIAECVKGQKLQMYFSIVFKMFKIKECNCVGCSAIEISQ